MLGYDFFYLNSTENIIRCFGRVISNTYVSKKAPNGNTQLLKVPLSFAQKDRINTARKVDASQNLEIMYPKMTFTIGFSGVILEKLPNKLNTTKSNISFDGMAEKSFAPVPFGYTISLTLYSNDIQDVLQIFEQIAPLFRPTITVKYIPFDGYKGNVDATFTITSITNDFEQVDSNPVYTITLEFDAQTYIFAPTESQPLILDLSKLEDVDINYSNYYDVLAEKSFQVHKTTPVIGENVDESYKIL